MCATTTEVAIAAEMLNGANVHAPELTQGRGGIAAGLIDAIARVLPPSRGPMFDDDSLGSAGGWYGAGVPLLSVKGQTNMKVMIDLSARRWLRFFP
jgi:hypothetical protein